MSHQYTLITRSTFQIGDGFSDPNESASEKVRQAVQSQLFAYGLSAVVGRDGAVLMQANSAVGAAYAKSKTHDLVRILAVHANYCASSFSFALKEHEGREEDRINEALSMLQGEGKKLQDARAALIAARDGVALNNLVRLDDIRAIVNVDNGVFRDVSSTHNLQIMKVEHEVQGMHESELSSLEDGRMVASTVVDVQVEPESCEALFDQLSMLVDMRRVRQQSAMRNS
jgi:hypothetical protein